MADPTDRLARTVLARNLKVKKGESVLIEAWTHGLPYVAPFVREARRLGARPTVLYEDEAAWWDAVESGRTKVFSRLSDAEKAAIKNANVYVYFWGPEDRPRMSRLPDEIQDKVTGYNEEWYDTARKAGLRGVRMNLGIATDPQAEQFKLNGTKWRSQMLEAGMASARAMQAAGDRIVKLLERGSEFHVQHTNGTDLTLRLKGVHARTDAGFVDDAALKRRYGMMTSNPSGQVLAAIDKTRASGTLVSNRPVYIGQDWFDGVRWTFEDGHLTSHSIGQGSEKFEKDYDAAPKARDRLTFISIGLNPKARQLPPTEDTEEGALLAGIGGNAGFGGSVQVPFQGFALLGGATLEIDGKAIARGGKIL